MAEISVIWPALCWLGSHLELAWASHTSEFSYQVTRTWYMSIWLYDSILILYDSICMYCIRACIKFHELVLSHFFCQPGCPSPHFLPSLSLSLFADEEHAVRQHPKVQCLCGPTAIWESGCGIESSVCRRYLGINWTKTWINMTGWWFQPLWKIWTSVGVLIPNIWKKKCSKPPTRWINIQLECTWKRNPNCSPLNVSNQGTHACTTLRPLHQGIVPRKTI